MKSLVLTLTVVFLFLVLLGPMVHTGFPDTHDGVNHLARIANYAVAFKQGQFPPRIAPTFMVGYGYPVFNYNYPLANILALPFLFLRVPVESALKIITVAGVLLGFYGTYRFLRSHVSRDAALFAAGAYLAAPFLFNNMYVRGVIGETLAYALFPHVLVGIRALFQKVDRKSVAYASLATGAFMHSHNIFVMYMAPLVALYVLFIMVKKRKPVLSYMPVIGTLLLGVALSMFFWLPAVFEQGYVNIALVNLTKFYSQHFPTLEQLFFAPWGYGLSYPGPVDTLSFNMGFIFLLAALISLVYLVRKRKHWGVLLCALLGGAAVLFLLLPFSLGVWERVSLLHFTQFPWRLLGILSLFGTVLCGYAYEDSHGAVRWMFVAALLIAAFSIKGQPVTKYIHHDDLYYKTYAETSTVQHEDQPATFTYIPLKLADDYPKYAEGEVITKDVWNGSHHVYTIYVPKDMEVTEETAYFPGWKAYVDNAEVPIEYWKADGLIRFTVPAGTHTIETIFTQETVARMVGNTLSVLAAVLLCAFLFVPRDVRTAKQRFLLLFSLFVLWRVGMQMVMMYAPNLSIFHPTYPYYRAFLASFGPAWLVRWGGFDGIHYLTIAVKGYIGTGNIQAFFPVYPYLIKMFHVGNALVSGIGISHVFAVLSLFMAHKLASLDSQWLRKHPQYIYLALLAFPVSFFLVSVYTESLFLFTTLLAFYCARTRRWGLAAMLVVIATATRVTGIFLVPALMAEAYTQRITKKALPWRTWLLISLGSLGLLGYMVYLWKYFGDPLYFFHVQNVFNPGRQSSLVLFPQVVYRYVKIFMTVRPETWEYYAYVQEFVLTMLAGILLIWGGVRRVNAKSKTFWMMRSSYLVYALGSFFLSPLTGTFTSMPRYLLVLFPLTFFIADISRTHRKAYWTLIAAGFLLLSINVMIFLQGRWVA